MVVGAPLAVATGFPLSSTAGAAAAGTAAAADPNEKGAAAVADAGGGAPPKVKENGVAVLVVIDAPLVPCDTSVALDGAA